MQQRRKLVLATLFFIGLAGCGTDDEGALKNLRQEDGTLPIGYYSNENHDNNGGNVTILDGNDNDGPATEILDHSFGTERNANGRTQENRSQGVNTRAENQRQGANIQSNFDRSMIGASDRNYHGHLANGQTPAGRTSYNRENPGNLSSQITQRVEKVDNVKEAETIINGRNVVVGVLLEKNENVEQTKKNIQNAIQPGMNGRQVQVLTNESQYNRIKVMNNDLKNGGPTDDIKKEIKNIVHTENQ